MCFGARAAKTADVHCKALILCVTSLSAFLFSPQIHSRVFNKFFRSGNNNQWQIWQNFGPYIWIGFIWSDPTAINKSMISPSNTIQFLYDFLKYY